MEIQNITTFICLSTNNIIEGIQKFNKNKQIKLTRLATKVRVKKF